MAKTAEEPTKAAVETPKKPPVQPCPMCGYVLEEHSGLGLNGEPPQDGDASICLNCGEIMVFNAKLELRKLTDKDKRDMGPQYASLMLAQTHIRRRGKIGRMGRA